jgi:hypothetical protein
MSAMLGAVLLLAACGTTASPSVSAGESASPQASNPAADVPAVICAPMEKPFDPDDIDLTGAWAGDDGGVYYLRQLGSVVWLNGLSGRDVSPMNLGRHWTNVGRGVIDGLEIDVETADVPRGELLFDSTLILTIQDDGSGNIEIVKTREVKGGFGNNVWTPCEPVELQVAEYVQTYGGDAAEFADILTSEACDQLTAMEEEVTTTMNSAEAGSPEFRAALGYSNAVGDRKRALHC